MSRTKTLYNLEEGERARVVFIESKGCIRNRLMDLGIVEGSEIECAFRSYANDPVAYYIRGAIIALRSEEANKIYVTS